MENNLNRAKQFMAFDALKGFRELLEDEENINSLKKTLSEDDYEELSKKINKIKKGDNIEVTYFSDKKYHQLAGTLSNINFNYKTIIIDNIKIKFQDISNINLC